jgi:hypothetical protein
MEDNLARRQVEFLNPPRIGAAVRWMGGSRNTQRQFTFLINAVTGEVKFSVSDYATTMHDEAIFRRVEAIDTIIDRIVHKTEMGRLLDHVRDLAPA